VLGIAGVVVWLGYAVFAFGWSQVRGCNAGFLAMIDPFAATQPKCAPDTPSYAKAPTETHNVGSPGHNQYKTKAEAVAAGGKAGGQFSVTHNPNGSWSILEA
jgi:hypothetical protein